MASALSSESPPPAKKRAKELDFESKIALSDAQLTSEKRPNIFSQSRKISESNGDCQNWFLPSSEVSALSSDEPEGVDSGFSDSATPPAYSEDSQDKTENSQLAPPSSSFLQLSSLSHEEENSILEDAADLHMAREEEAKNMTTNGAAGDMNETQDDDDDEDDRLSNISGLSDLSGSEWKPMAGPFSWVQKQMISGADPRALLNEMLSCDTVIPDHLDQLTLWKIILNMVSEPPRRKKLAEFNTLSDVVELIRKSRKIVILTGAGVSVSCGIPDFRSRDGVYARLAVDFPDLPDPQAMFDIHYFRKDPRPFFKFAREIYPGQFEPSPCHKFIRCVEKQGKLLRNYTQNIDTLEQVVGIQNVVQCHGSFATATCMVCKHRVDAEVIRNDIFAQQIPMCPKCSISGLSAEPVASTSSDQIPDTPSIMKPDIVFFGEGLGNEFHDAVAKDKNEVDLLIMIGSSLKVRPVALIPSSIDPSVPQVLINREPLPHLTPDVELLGDCDGIINQICHLLGQGWEEPVHKDVIMRETSELSEEKPPKKEAGDEPAQGSSADMAKLWEPKTRPSIAQRLKPNEYLFVPPSRYVFPGAEVLEADDDDDSSSSNSSGSSDTDSDDEDSADEPASKSEQEKNKKPDLTEEEQKELPSATTALS